MNLNILAASIPDSSSLDLQNLNLPSDEFFPEQLDLLNMMSESAMDRPSALVSSVGEAGRDGKIRVGRFYWSRRLPKDLTSMKGVCQPISG